jgi:CHAT domain-containing protein
MQEINALVLEVLKQDNRLSMSLFEQREHVSTVRHYSQCTVSFIEIDKLCQEIVLALNCANKEEGLNKHSLQRLIKPGQLLWDNLLTRPVKDKLKNTAIKGLVLSLDEELIHIPWELLYDGRDFLCLKFNLGRLVRTKVQMSQPQYRSLNTCLKMLILVNPTGDLKSAYLEGKFIRNQFDRKRNQIKIDFKSTDIDTLYVKKNLRDYDIVHFAGHCEYDMDNPKRSGWVLNDGRFTTQDILALSESLSLPSLVFSNACHSAQGPGNLMEIDYQEKTYSLAAAFLFSGVRHYIGAIWKIEDPVSLVFAKEFYTHLTNGDSVGECMRLGRLKLIKDYGLSCIFWASYLLYGDPNFILFKTKAKLPPLKLKRKIYPYLKQFTKHLLFIVILSVGISLIFWLRTLHPSNYLLFLKSQKLFLKGKNQAVISLSQEIIRRDPLFLAIYPLLADTYRRQGECENALKYYFAYALNAQKKNDKKSIASAYIGIAWTYHLAGEYPKAFEFYQKAISLSQENKDKLNEAAALEKLAVWHIDKEEYDKALELLTKSTEINRERQSNYQHRYHLACDYFDLGLVFVNKDDFTIAKEFYQKSQALFEKLNLKYELSDCYFNLGEICLYEKQYQKALDYYFRGLAIDKAQNNLLSLSSDNYMIGELYLEIGDLVKAEEYFNQAASIAEKIDAKPELASIYFDFGLLYKQKNKKNIAREYFRKAQELYRKMDLPTYQKIQEELFALNNGI